ncbi:MAG: Hsp20/alpha crystallin family protein [Syntrophomonadaceae bacterium]|nr:Hsp20/alpha crystallin family protein [Syntrophomonadaceae bacterium]
MSLMRWMPFREHFPFRDLRMELEDMFDFPRIAQNPRIDMYETDSEVVVSAEVPGVESKNDIEVSVSENQLSLSGEIKKTRDVSEQGIHRSERYYGRFYRTIPLPPYVDTEASTASYNNGILEIRIPKTDERQGRSRRLEIQ